MKLQAKKKETVILNPRKEMAPRRIPSEIRRDPLTGRTARICHFMKLKWEKPDFDEMAARAGAFCPFCPENVMKVTPAFPAEILPEGRLVSGDMALFPNLAPYDAISAVAVMAARHFKSMTEISAGRITRAFQLAMDFFRRLDALDHPESVYHLVNWNYMPISGSSLLHPHLQVFATADAPNLLREELTAARAYMEKNGANFWDDLVAFEESAGERRLGAIGRTTWLTAYAPMGVAGDVLAVVDGASSALDLTDEDLAHLADGLTRVMAGYDKMGIHGFNMNFFPGARGDGFTRFHLCFSPRAYFNQNLGTPDIGALRNLYNESLCMAYPEEINKMLKEDF
ncbi:MAG: hypothetical protein GY859_03325 [Desulfobacterales bacterium]|nr:hypothetical protein [Desulfobacterales bacterium]